MESFRCEPSDIFLVTFGDEEINRAKAAPKHARVGPDGHVGRNQTASAFQSRLVYNAPLGVERPLGAMPRTTCRLAPKPCSESMQHSLVWMAVAVGPLSRCRLRDLPEANSLLDRRCLDLV